MPTFTTSGPATVVLNIHSVANVYLTASDRTDTVVEVAPTTASKALDVNHADNTRIDYLNGEVRVTTPRHSLMSPRTRSVDITIEVPAGSIVRGTAGGGEFRSVGRLASCDYTVQGGSITVDQVGPATLKTAAGDIRVAHATNGAVKATTQAGSIDIGVSSNAAVSLSTNTMYGTVSNGLSAEHDGRATTDTVELDIQVMSGDINVHRASESRTAIKR